MLSESIFQVPARLICRRPMASGTDFIGRRQINRAGTWKIDSLSISGRPVAGSEASSLYFDFGGRVVRSDGVHHEIGKSQADKARGTFEIKDIPFGGDLSPIQGSYRVEGDRIVLD